MTQITFMNISQFIEFCAAMTEKERTFYARNGELVEHPNTKKIHGFNFHPIILMSLDMERELRKKAGVMFQTSGAGKKLFNGIEVINIIADGYLSFCWEADK